MANLINGVPAMVSTHKSPYPQLLDYSNLLGNRRTLKLYHLEQGWPHLLYGGQKNCLQKLGRHKNETSNIESKSSNNTFF